MNADNGQAGSLIFVMPIPQLRDDIAAIDSTVGPKFYQDHAASQARDR